MGRVSDGVVEKPWGYYEDLFRTDEVVFKKIVVTPGEEISYQLHHKREEFWYVTEGFGIFIYNKTNWKVSPGFTIHIRKNDSHQIVNTGSDDLVVFEMQYGVCLEDDIVRFDDKYGRD